jgi:hypothetical protein
VAVDVSDAFRKEYSNFLEQTLQVADSRLQRAVTFAGGYRGEKVQPVKRIGTFEFAERMSRLQPTINVEPTYSSRSIGPRIWQVAPIFDRTDEFFIGFSPESQIAVGGRSAFNRKKDSVIASAFFATALTGKDGATSTIWDTTQDVATSVGGSGTGFNYEKFLAGLELLGRNQALETERPFVLLSYAQQTRFLKQLEVISSEYNLSVQKDDTGRIRGFMGAEVIVGDYAELLPSANLRYVPMWVPSAMHLGMWDDLMVSFDERVDLSHAMQIFHEFVGNATRLDEKRIVRIQCVE